MINSMRREYCEGLSYEQRGYVKITKVQLEKLLVGIEHHLSTEMLCDAHLECFLDEIAHDLIIRLRSHIWAEKESVQHHEIEYPRDWWQAVKERFAPRWFLERWPVEYTAHVIDVHAIYPSFRPAVPDQEWRLTIYRF